MPLPIRRPARVHAAREPDMPVVRIVTPVAVVVEILVADDIVRHVLRRPRIVPASVSAIGPIVELIRIAKLIHLGVQIVRPTERAARSGLQRIALPIPGRFALAFSNRDHGVGAVCARLHPITARLVDRERQIRRVDFENIVLVQFPHANVDRARRKLDLNRVIIQIQKREAGIGIQTNHCRPQLQLGARILIRPELVARRQWTIRHRSHPIRLARGLERNRAFHVSNSSHAARRIVLLILILLILILPILILPIPILLILILRHRGRRQSHRR